MAVTARIQRTGKDISVLVNEALSPKAQSKAIAGFAREKLAEAEQQNRRAIGRVPEHQTIVDGRREAPLDAVKPDGVIVFEFELVTELLGWIAGQLRTHSPSLTGRYAASHKLFADGAEVDANNPPAAEVYEFLPVGIPYARKIERGLSPQAPDGVYQVVAELAAKRFGNQANIQFTYTSVAGSDRQPAIVVTPR
jgi:hypothetical protein